MSGAEVALKLCPWCGEAQHLRIQSVGSLTSDMPDRPYRVICTHIDHDTVCGPVDYGKPRPLPHGTGAHPKGTLTMADAEQIAAGLTKAQRDWIMSAPLQKTQVTVQEFRIAPTPHVQLEPFGKVHFFARYRVEGDIGRFSYWQELTPLGLEVRRIL